MLERVLAALAILVLLPGAAGAETLTAGGQERHYSLFRPPALGRERPVPLVVMLHGGFGTAEQARRSYGWDEMAAAKGFVVVYPDGARRSWNAGGTCCGPAFRDQADDARSPIRPSKNGIERCARRCAPRGWAC